MRVMLTSFDLLTLLHAHTRVAGEKKQCVTRTALLAAMFSAFLFLFSSALRSAISLRIFLTRKLRSTSSTTPYRACVPKSHCLFHTHEVARNERDDNLQHMQYVTAQCRRSLMDIGYIPTLRRFVTRSVVIGRAHCSAHVESGHFARH